MKKKKLLISLISVFVVVTVVVAFCGVYVSDYYRAETEAFANVSAYKNVTRKINEDGNVVYEPDNPIAGLIFYPGGKVEYTAYEPLMASCAEKGILCVLVEMPFNLAVFDVKAADGIQEKYPEIENWYIGGHSLGGSMAAAYLGENEDDFEGLVLLGSYSTEDLSDTDLKVLSVYGSEDKVLNREKYDENKTNLPDDFTEIVIEGGCHAYFGMYGNQEGDGTPTITAREQIEITAEKIAESEGD